MSGDFIEQPVLVLGAPRSGTKMFRETMRLHPDIFGLTYELERVWCHGNMDRYNMSIPLERLTPSIKNHIHGFFSGCRKKNPGKRILAKSTLLPLRVPFIRAVFPDAPIIHIFRDGRDSACSIRDRHMEPLEWEYLVKHRVFPPLNEFPYYLSQFVSSRFKKKSPAGGVEASWGPQFDDMEQLREKYTLLEICGIQWNRCIMGMSAGRAELEKGPYMEIRYEDLVERPQEGVENILSFLRLRGDAEIEAPMIANVARGRAGRWKKELSPVELELLMPHISEGLKTFGYIPK